MLSFVSRSARRLTSGPGAAALVERLAAGDASALEPLYRLEADAVYRFALALCGNPAWAADATQEAFVALADRPRAWDPARGSLGAWLAGVARHALLAVWRATHRHEPWPDDDEDDLQAAADSPETLLVQAQDLDRVWRALRTLPWPFREAVVLVDLQERPYTEAAAVAGIEVNTLRTRLHRGRLRLADALRGEPGARS